MRTRPDKGCDLEMVLNAEKRKKEKPGTDGQDERSMNAERPAAKKQEEVMN